MVGLNFPIFGSAGDKNHITVRFQIKSSPQTEIHTLSSPKTVSALFSTPWIFQILYATLLSRCTHIEAIPRPNSELSRSIIRLWWPYPVVSELILHFCQCFRMYGTDSRRSELSRTSHVAPVTDTTFWPKIENKKFQKKWFFENKILRKKWIFFWKKNIFWFLRSFRIGWLTFSCSGRLRGAGNRTILSRYPARPSIAATFHCDHSDFLDFFGGGGEDLKKHPRRTK